MSEENQILASERSLEKCLRRLPHSLDAELAVLGSVILYGCKSYDRFSSFLRPEHFVLNNHGTIYEQVCAIIDAHGACDSVLLQNWFAVQKAADSSWCDTQEIVEFCQYAASPINAEQYARHLVELYQRRKAIDLAEGLIDRAYESDAADSATDQISDAVTALTGLIAAGPADQSFRNVGTILDDVFDIAEDRLQKLHTGEVSDTVLSGIRSLDGLIGGFDPGTVTLLAGRPSMGKSTVAANMALNAASINIPVHFFTMEVRDDALVRQSIQARVTRLSGHKLRTCDGLSKSDIERARRATLDYGLDKIPLHICHAPALTTVQMRQLLVKEFGDTKPGIVFVDYLQIMRAADKKSYTRNDEVSQLSRDIKAIAVELRVPIILLSQLSRAVETREDKRPQLSDLRDSGSLEQDADSVIFLYRDHYYKSRKNGREIHCGPDQHADIVNDIEFNVAKQRSGPVGTVNGWFSGMLGYVGDEPLS